MSDNLTTFKILEDLRFNHYTTSVKAEFETEGASCEEIHRLKDMAGKLPLTIKIGGCEAITDMKLAKELGAKSIVAPMIETPYALKKFVNAANTIFSRDVNLYINIETITGYKNLEDICSCEAFKSITGVILGRGDMLASMDDPDESRLLEIAKNMSEKMQSLNKEYIIGGNVSAEIISFLSDLPYFTGYETRKIIFDTRELIVEYASYEGIVKALEFEISWLKDKIKSGTYTISDVQRIKILEKRINNSKLALKL